VQLGEVVGLDHGDPGVEPFTVAAGEHLTERGHMNGDRVQVLAWGADLLELDLLVGSRSSERRRIHLAMCRTFGGVAAAGGGVPSARKGRR
jgi:hypothetical protein